MPEIERKEKVIPLTYAAALAVIVVDRITKVLVCNMMSEGQSIPVIRRLFHITVVFNKGIAFGLFRDGPWVFIFLSIGIIGLVSIYLFHKKRNDLITNLSCALLMGGAAGNLIDRLRFGCVIDFLDFRVWPVFNVADSAITVGAALLAWRFIGDRKETLVTRK